MVGGGDAARASDRRWPDGGDTLGLFFSLMFKTPISLQNLAFGT